MTVVTPNSITVQGRGGLSIELQFRSDDGAPRDVSAASLYFEVDGVLRVPIAAGADAATRNLLLTRDEVTSIGVKYRDFACIDETGGTAVVFWAGIIEVKGFTEQPA